MVGDPDGGERQARGNEDGRLGSRPDREEHEDGRRRDAERTGPPGVQQVGPDRRDPPAPIPATIPVTASAATAETGIPIRSVSTIALRTAPGTLGCWDRTARAMYRKGTRQSPNAISGPGTGPPPSSDAADTTPARTDQ